MTNGVEPGLPRGTGAYVVSGSRAPLQAKVAGVASRPTKGPGIGRGVKCQRYGRCGRGEWVRQDVPSAPPCNGRHWCRVARDQEPEGG